MPRIRSALSAALAAALLPIPATAQQQPLPPKATVAQRVDSLVRTRLADPQGPASVSMMIVRAGDTLVHRAWGAADAATNRPATEASTYQLASTSKQFTAALILKLVDRRKLSLGDTLGRYLTGLRPEWRPLTIEQLLNHTSGLHREYRPPTRLTESQPGDTLLAWARRDTMAFAPGTRWGYSNTGYMILGVLVEKLYGKRYGDVLRDEIARPLGLTTLGWCTAPEKRATETQGHRRSAQGALQPSPEVSTDLALGGGGLCASAGDLARWNLALHGGRVLSPASYAAMTTPRGAAVSEGYGFGIRSQRAPWGTTILGHDGGTLGFLAETWWLPDESLSVAVVQNSLPTTHLFPVLARIALGQTPPGAVAAAASAGIPVAKDAGAGLEGLVGFYEGARLGRGITITLENGMLYGEPTGSEKRPLVLQSGTTYYVGREGSPLTVTFTLGADGRATALVFRQGNGPERTFPKVRGPAPRGGANVPPPHQARFIARAEERFRKALAEQQQRP
jgi:D-alanyl-D-alanine carboxypeptidase